MPEFSYIVLDPQGKEKRGKLEATDRTDAVRQLRTRSWVVVEMSEGEGRPQGGWAVFKSYLVHLDIRRYMKVRQVDRVAFFRQLSLMLRSGHTILQCLESLSSGLIERYRLQTAVARMATGIREGKSFSRAVREQKVFSNFIASLIESGEASGDLDSIMERIADDLERKMELRRALITSLTYPVITIFASVAVVLFLVLGVVPKFARFLSSKGTDLPPSTQRLMDMAAFMEESGLTLGITIGLVVFLILASYTTKKGKEIIDAILLRIPIISGAITSSSMATMGWTLSMLLKSGMTALDALRVTAGIIPNASFSNALTYSADEVLRGKSLSVAIGQRVFPKMVRHLAVVGEQSGEMDNVMEEIGLFYKKDMDAKISRMTAMIEPALTLFVGGMVGFVYFAFFQAVMAVSTGGR